jgi:hypothetical protein
MSEPKPVEDVVERKVISSSLVTLAVSLLIALLNGVAADSTLLGALPPVVQAIILASVPPLVTFAAGYATPSNRVDQVPRRPQPW